MGPDLSDEELLAAFQQGDAGAFERLLRRHRGPLYTFLLRMLGDAHKAEDLAQETFLRIVRGAAAWQERARFTTWMYTIARNLCADAARRERVRGAESLDEQAAGKDGEEGRPLVDEVPGDGAAPDRGAESLRLRPVLLRARSSCCASRRACRSGRSPRCWA